MKKYYFYVLFVYLIFLFSCSKEKPIKENIIDNDYTETYILSSIDILYKNENINLNQYKKWENKEFYNNIYIKIIKLDLSNYKIESNFWVQLDEINLNDHLNNFDHISYNNKEWLPYTERGIADEDLTYQMGAVPPFIQRKNYFDFYFNKDEITIDYSYEDSYLEKIIYEENTEIFILEDGTIKTNKKSNIDYTGVSEYLLMLKCRIIFKRI